MYKMAGKKDVGCALFNFVLFIYYIGFRKTWGTRRKLVHNRICLIPVSVFTGRS